MRRRRRPITPPRALRSQSLQQTIDYCDTVGTGWRPAIPINTTLDCYVHRDDVREAYLSVSEPPEFYADLVLLALCLFVAIGFVVLVANAHKDECLHPCEYLRRVRATLDRARTLVKRASKETFMELV